MKRNAVKNKMKCEMEFGFNKAAGLQSAKPLKTNFNVDVSREFLKIFILLNLKHICKPISKDLWVFYGFQKIFTPFQATDLFFYPFETSEENQRFSYFQEV